MLSRKSAAASPVQRSQVLRSITSTELSRTPQANTVGQERIDEQRERTGNSRR
jgi:hypothetical protein